MSTVEIGNKFEEQSYSIIETAIRNGDLGISATHARVYKKKRYYSKDREKDIIFDLAVEIWPNNAERYSVVYLIECKSYRTENVPVCDIEEFQSKIKQVSGVNVKGIMISDSSFQRSTYNIAKNNGFMLIEVRNSYEYSIILHKATTKNEKQDSIDDQLFKMIKKSFTTISGLEHLKKNSIDSKAMTALDTYEYETSKKSQRKINLAEYIRHLKSYYQLEIKYGSYMSNKGKKVLGYYDREKNQILINHSIVGTNRFRFVLGHELGHFFLHKSLKINEQVYSDFEDFEFDDKTLFNDENIPDDDRKWIEWQANKFSVFLFLPKNLFIAKLYEIRKKKGIARYERFYLDNQPTNIREYNDTVSELSRFFEMSISSIKYRVEELKLIIKAHR